MTKKEHLLKLLPKIEYDLPLKDLNLILDAMQSHTDQQLILSGVSQQRELLIALIKHYENMPLTIGLEEPEFLVDKFLAINCN